MRITGGVFGQKSVNLQDYDNFLDWLVEQGGEQSAQEMYKTVAWAFYAANLRADNVASIPYALYDADSDEDEEEGEREFDIDMRPILWLVEAWWNLAGAAYVLKRRNRVTVPELQVLNANTMRIKKLDPKTGKPAVFEQHVGSQTRDYPAEDMVYFQAFSPTVDAGPGVTSGGVAQLPSSLILNANKWAASFFGNGAIPTVFLTTEGSVPPNEKDRIQGVWTKMLQGVKNAFKTIVLERGLTPTVVGQPIGDLAMPDLEATKRNQILAAHGIPPGLGETKTNRSEREALQYELWTQTLIPHCEVWIEPTLNEQLFEELGLRISFHYGELEIIQAREIEKAAASSFIVNGVMLPMFQAGTATKEEVRRVANSVLTAIDLPALDEKMPEEAEPEAEPEADQLPEGQLEEEGQAPGGGGSNFGTPRLPSPQRALSEFALSDLHRWREKCRKRDKAAEFSSDAIPEWMIAQVQKAIDITDHVEAFRFLKQIESMRDADEARVEKEMSRLFKTWLPIFTAAVLAQEQPDYVAFGNAIKGVLLPLFVTIYVEQAMRASAETGIGIDPAELNDEALSWATAHVAQVTSQMLATTRKVVDKVWAAVEESPETETEDDLMLLLLPAFSVARARMVAITEVTTGRNTAVMAVNNLIAPLLALAGYVSMVYWRTARDERVCFACGPLDGTTFDVWGSDFPLGPPAHPNCRCQLEINI